MDKKIAAMLILSSKKQQALAYLEGKKSIVSIFSGRKNSKITYFRDKIIARCRFLGL